ncbi:MAG: hypothetical protein GY705_21650 [Bacteroidetes bacterium]|nr:hypothetical protein [Bacteroidota bacterium]
MLENWLRPVSERAIPDNMDGRHLGGSLEIYTHELPDLTNTRVALIGLGEKEANAIRKELYLMSFPFQNLHIADIGNVRNSEPAFVAQLIKELLDSKIFPILIGGSDKQVVGHYQAYHNFLQSVNFVLMDEQIPYSIEGTSPPDYLNTILDSKRSGVFHFSIIGCQTHFVPAKVFQHFDKLYHEYVRLGKARSSLAELEPIIRDADMMGINISALKYSEAPAQKNTSPSGFFSEEACQIARYAGMSDKLTSVGFYGFELGDEPDILTAQVVGQMIWYFLDGFYNRKKDFPASTDGLVEYIVDIKKYEYQLTFWKSKKSGRWWMQVPVRIKQKYERHRLIPCSYNDYKMACHEELPERLLNALRRYV